MRMHETRPETYSLFGMAVKSYLPLSGAAKSRAPADVELRLAPSTFREAGEPGIDWFFSRRLADGGRYLCWRDVFELWIDGAGNRVWCRPLRGANALSFRAHILAQALSFPLLKRGIEPLHGTAVVVKGRAIAFLGDCGRGKSTLGAAFHSAGHAILTDDLLAVTPGKKGFEAHAGIAHVKLFPDSAAASLGGTPRGAPLLPGTGKRVFPLPARRVSAPLAAICVLGEASDEIRLTPCSPAEAVIELVRHTFNTIVADRKRIDGQFRSASRLAAAVPVLRLDYPRRVESLGDVREKILEELG